MKNMFYEYNRDKDINMHVGKGINNVASLHFHRGLEILYVISGRMECVVGDEKFLAVKDEIIFVHNYYAHSFYPVNEYEKLYFIVPSGYGDDLSKVLSVSTLPSRLSDTEFNKTLFPIFEKMYNERDTMLPLVRKGYLNVVVGSLFEHYPSFEIKRQKKIEFMVEVLQYIDENYKEELTLDSVSSHFGYNKYYFSRTFNKYIGENLSNYINIVRLQQFMKNAKKIDNPCISRLAFECGFDSLTTFYRYFNKLYGESPNSYIAKKGLN